MSGCELHQIFLGEVASVQNYGAFIKIPGCTQQGLVHKSQVSSVRVDDVGEVLQRGERVWCKVISINEDGKIGLSMKYVNQGNGKDLDPNQVDLERDAQKRRTVGSNRHKVIQLQAVFDTTCTKCGTHGHLARDCFMTPDGKKYELLPEIDDPTPIVQTEKKELVEKKQKVKKIKKSKKSKKGKRKKDVESENSDNEDKPKSKKKKKKHSRGKKKKKKKNDSSDTDSSSDSSISSGSSVSSHDIKAHKRKHSETTSVSVKKRKR